MSKRLYGPALVLAVALVAIFAARSLSGEAAAPQRPKTGAAEAAGEGGGGGRWEYCAVTRAQYVASNRGGTYWISYFRNGAVQVVEVDAGVTENALAKAVYRLGEDGWEMVGEGPLEVGPRGPREAPNALYFKRRK